jgi:hypothetical protein
MDGVFMGKRSFALLMALVMVIMIPYQAFASTNTSLFVAYDSMRDNYMVSYYKQIPDRPSSFIVKFVNPANTSANAEKTFYGDDVSGIFYLTCNGQYTFDFYDSGGVLKTSSGLITTSLVKNNVCSSFPNPTDQYVGQQKPVNQNTISIGNQTTPEGEKTYLYWHATDCPYGTQYYDIYKDGALMAEYVDAQLFQYPITGDPGLWRVENLGCGTDNKVGEIPYSPSQVTTGVLTDPWSGVAPSGDGSSPQSPKIPPDPNAPVTNGSLDTSLTNCGTVICDCIKSLQPALDQIQKNTGDLLPKVDNLILSVKDVKTSVDLLKDQLMTDTPYPIDSVASKIVPSIEDNKPPMHETGKFEDTTTYFTDQGDAVTPEPLPVAPEPSTSWKDKNGTEVSKQTMLQKSPSLQQDSIITKQPVPNRQTAPTRQTVPTRQTAPTRDIVPTRTPVLQQDKTDYRQQLRWDSNQYRP